MQKLLLQIKLPRNRKSSVKCWSHWGKRNTSHTNYRYLAWTTHIVHFSIFFIVKLKLVKKSNSFLLLQLTLTLHMMLTFKKSNTFHCVQAAKTIKSKVLLRIKFCWRWPQILVHFADTTFLVKRFKRKNQSTKKLRIGSHF